MFGIDMFGVIFYSAVLYFAVRRYIKKGKRKNNLILVTFASLELLRFFLQPFTDYANIIITIMYVFCLTVIIILAIREADET